MNDKYKITEMSIVNNKLVLKLKNINLSIYCDVDVCLKNIKTKEIFTADSFLGEDKILINLDSVRDLCTDNEYNLMINFQNEHNKEGLSTIISSELLESKDLDKLDLHSLGWFLRIADKNTPLLSSIRN
ncbi:MAG: hypothetical protein RR620_05710 [Clostridium sp.]